MSGCLGLRGQTVGVEGRGIPIGLGLNPEPHTSIPSLSHRLGLIPGCILRC